MHVRFRGFRAWCVLASYIEGFLSLVRFGGDLLSHVLRRSTIGVGALIGRVRDGIGSFTPAMTTKPDKRQAGQTSGRRGRIRAPFGHALPNISVVSKSKLLAHAHSNVLLLTLFGKSEGSVRRTFRPLLTLLFPDQIKPIGPLVPVS